MRRGLDPCLEAIIVNKFASNMLTHKHLCACCSTWISVARPLVDLQGAFEKIDQPAVDVLLRTRHLELCLTAFRHSLSAMKPSSTPGLVVYDAVAHDTWVQRLQNWIRRTYSGSLKMGSQWFAEALIEKLERSCHELQQVAGGAADGKSWYDSHTADVSVVTHFENTLDRVDKNQITTHKNAVTKVTRLSIVNKLVFVFGSCPCASERHRCLKVFIIICQFMLVRGREQFHASNECLSVSGGRGIQRGLVGWGMCTTATSGDLAKPQHDRRSLPAQMHIYTHVSHVCNTSAYVVRACVRDHVAHTSS